MTRQEDMDIAQLRKAKEKHKEIFYKFLTDFAYLDAMIAYCIASHFKKDRDEKVELADLLISEFNSQKQFDIFLRILRVKSISETEVSSIEKLYSTARHLRNFLAHSYLVPTNNLKYNGKSIKLTRLINSKGTAKLGKGYSENLIINDYDNKQKHLSDLVAKVFKMSKDNFD